MSAPYREEPATPAAIVDRAHVAPESGERAERIRSTGWPETISSSFHATTGRLAPADAMAGEDAVTPPGVSETWTFRDHEAPRDAEAEAKIWYWDVAFRQSSQTAYTVPDPSTARTGWWAVALPGASSTRTLARHVSPASGERAAKMSQFPFRRSRYAPYPPAPPGPAAPGGRRGGTAAGASSTRTDGLHDAPSSTERE